MNTLGISAYYHDSAAALVRDGAIMFSFLTTNSESVHGKEVLRGTRRQKAGKTIAILGLTFKP